MSFPSPVLALSLRPRPPSTGKHSALSIFMRRILTQMNIDLYLRLRLSFIITHSDHFSFGEALVLLSIVHILPFPLVQTPFARL